MLTKIENVPFTTTSEVSDVDFVALSNSTLKTRIAHTISQEVIAGFRAWPVWGLMGWDDIRQRYRRSVIGPFWITLSMGIFILVLGVIYSRLFHTELKSYLPYLTAGFIVWGFMSAAASESCIAFIDGARAYGPHDRGREHGERNDRADNRLYVAISCAQDRDDRGETSLSFCTPSSSSYP
jgi:ABC-2 type transporter